MRRLSIKGKVTIWYTAFVVVIALLALGVAAFYAKQMVFTEQEEELREGVADFAEELEVNGNQYEAEDGRFYDEDIVFSVYNSAGELVEGNVPSSFPRDTTLKHGVIQTISAGEQEWLTYDIALDYGGDQVVWVRGIIYTGLVSTVTVGVLLLFCILLPILVILAAVGGYAITRRAFMPVEQIRRTAAEIAHSGNLSRRVRAEEASGEMYDLAATFNEMLGSLEGTLEDERRFTADVSHELRTPVSVIMAQGEYALLDEATEEERKDALQVIVGQARKMTAMISQLLEMARRERASGNAGWRRIELGSVAETVAAELRPAAEKKRISIEADCGKGADVLGEQTAFARIFTNLVSNAIQYGREDGHIWVCVRREGETVLCTVQDDGIGIGAEDLPHIFRRFYRADRARSGRGEAHAGLGLSMVKLLTEQFGGQIQAASRQGEGTTFTLRFPALRNGEYPLQ